MNLEYMLDTDTVSYFIRGRSKALEGRLRSHDPGSICVSCVTRGELRYGVARSGSKKIEREVELFLEGIASIAWDQSAADRYGLVRANLERSGDPIGNLDTIIAAHALSAGLVLVTINARHFSRVKGLETKNWL